jgi:hypothetical protein
VFSQEQNLKIVPLARLNLLSRAPRTVKKKNFSPLRRYSRGKIIFWELALSNQKGKERKKRKLATYADLRVISYISTRSQMVSAHCVIKTRIIL